MISENLSVKIEADVGPYKQGMKDATAATENFSKKTKEAETPLEKLKAKIDKQASELKELKTEYQNVVLSQGKASKAAQDLEEKMRKLNTTLKLNQTQLTSATAAGSAFTSSLDSKDVDDTAYAFGGLASTLQQMSSMNMASAMVNLMASLQITKDHVRRTTSAFKQFKEEVRGIFNFKDFDVGEDGIKGIFETMKIQGKEATKSLGIAFKNLGKSIKAAMSTAAAAIAAAVAVMVSFVLAIKNAISTAQRLKQTFYEAQKIGMSLKSYEEWAYIMGQVGVEADKLSDFLKTLADEQNAVRDGSEDIIKAFEAIGLSAEEVAGMSQEKLFEATVRGLQNLESEVQRTSVAYRIFGEDAAELTNVLNLNSEQMEQMLKNYRLLGGEASDSLIDKSLTLSSAISDLKTAWRGLTNTLGEGFMPMIISVVRWLTKAVATVNMFIRALFGFDIIAKSTTKASSSMDSYNSAMGAATKTAEKLKRTTQGFDELNIVNDPNKSSTDGGGGFGGDYDLGIEIPDLNQKFNDLGLDKVAEKIQQWANTIRAIVPAAMLGVGLVGGVLAALSGNWVLAIALFAMAGFGLVAMTSGEGGFQGYINNFATACNGLLVPAMIAVGAVGGIIALLTGNVILGVALLAMAGIGIALTTTDAFQGLADGFAQKMTMIALSAMAVIGIVGGIIALLFGAIPVAIGLFAMAGIGIAGLTMGGFWDDIGQWFGELFAGIGKWASDVWQKIVEIFKGVGKWFGERFGEAWKGIKDAWASVKEWFKKKWEDIKSVFASIKSWFKEKFQGAWTGIKEAWSSVKTWFSEKWAGIKSVFSGVKTWFKEKFKDAWEGIKSVFSGVGSFFTDVWNKIKKIFKDAGGAIADAVSGAFKKGLNWVLEKAIKIINGFIDGINFAIGIINKIPGVNIKTIGRLDVPQLATGGIVMGDTLARIGEGGKREAVLPLDQNTGWMDLLADRIAARSQGPSKIVLQLGEKELGWATINSINSITKQTGGLQLHIV